MRKIRMSNKQDMKIVKEYIKELNILVDKYLEQGISLAILDDVACCNFMKIGNYTRENLRLLMIVMSDYFD